MYKIFIFLTSILSVFTNLSVSCLTWQESYDSTLYYFDNGDVKTALVWGKKSMTNAEIEYGINSIEYEKIIFVMVDLYYYEKDFEKALEIAKLDSSVTKNVFGGGSENYCGSLNNLGLIYYLVGNYNSSEIVIKEAKNVHESMTMLNDSAYAFTINNLALVYEITGKFLMSEQLYSQALELIKDTTGFSYAETVHNLSALYRRMGRYAKAETLYKKSLQLNKHLKGEMHVDVASGYHNLGDLYKLMGRYDEAETSYKKAVQMRKDIYGKEHSEYAKSLSNLGLLYYLMGRYEQSEPLFLEAMEIQLKKKGEDHPEFIATQNNLALLYDSMGRLHEADTLFSKSLVLYKKKFGEEHPYYATGLIKLAKLKNRIGDFLKAEEMYLKALNLRINLYGKEDTSYIKLLVDLSKFYEDNKKFNKALDFSRRALDIYHKKALLEYEKERETKSNKTTANHETIKTGKDYALMFAIDEYENAEFLKNPVLDSRMIGQELRENYSFEVDFLENATQNEVLTKLRKYSLIDYQPEDQLFIFFAGHGYFDNVFQEGFIVTKDSKFDQSLSTLVSFNRLRAIINNIPCKHIFLVMDVCFGGTFDPKVMQLSREIEIKTDIKEYIDKKMKYKTRKYLTSGGKETVPDGIPGSNSPFSRKILEALRSYGNEDRILTLSEFISYIEILKPQPFFNEFGENEPGSDFIFVAK